MDPGDGEHERDLHALERMRDPEGIKLLRIKLLLREQALTEPRADDMKRDQRGDAKPQYQLQRLQRGPAELPALVERPQAKGGMDQRRAVEDDRHGGELPELCVVVDAVRQRIERDVAERMVEEMADQIA